MVTESLEVRHIRLSGVPTVSGSRGPVTTVGRSELDGFLSELLVEVAGVGGGGHLWLEWWSYLARGGGRSTTNTTNVTSWQYFQNRNRCCL